MPTEHEPLVSVVVIFLNAGSFLRDAMDSVLRQTYWHWELFLVDDGSTDGSSEVARGFAARHADRVRCLEHEGHRNRGMSASRNLGVRNATGRFITFLDSDDVWLPERLATHVALMAAHPEAAVISGPTRLWYGWTGKPEDAAQDALRTVSEPMDALYRPPELLRRFLTGRALTPAMCSVLIRKEAFARLGVFEERFTGLYEDQAFFLKAYLKLPVYLTSTCADWYRQHEGSHSAEALRTGRYFTDRPGPALLDLFLWLARYLVKQGAIDRIVWTALLGNLFRIGLHRTMTIVNRPAKRVLAWLYEVKMARAAKTQGERRHDDRG